jgi:ABC-2 type transport system permease protein
VQKGASQSKKFMLRALIKKEFSQIFRNPSIIRLMLMAPVMQLILIPFAADFEVKNIHLAVLDWDHSSYSQKIVQRLGASGYFIIKEAPANTEAAQEALDHGRVDMVLEIPQRFERDLVREDEAKILLKADAVNGVKAGLAINYCGQIINQVNNEIRLDFVQFPRFNPMPMLDISTRYWYNPSFNYRHYMAPGILALLLIMVGSIMCALNIVREREIGTMEQMNVTPVKSYQFLLAKLIPFWVIGMMSLTIGLVVCYVVFGLYPLGSYLTIYLYAMVYMVAALGIGQLLASFSDTQQQVTLISFFFMMMFVLLSGLYTSIESMPAWAKYLAWANPVSHFVDVMRSVMLKGSTVTDLLPRMWNLIGFAVLFNALAVMNYRKRAS